MESMIERGFVYEDEIRVSHPGETVVLHLDRRYPSRRIVLPVRRRTDIQLHE